MVEDYIDDDDIPQVEDEDYDDDFYEEELEEE